MPTFADLGLSEPLCRALDDLTDPTGIQVRAVPQVLKGRDMLALAPESAGKSTGIVLGILQKLIDPTVASEPREPRAVVLCNDRERAEQLGVDFENFGRFVQVRNLVATEATGWNHQIHELRTGVEVLVATPKRLFGLLRQRAVQLRGVEIVVLDDADQMLDPDVIRDLDRILAELPVKRQTVMFASSAPTDLRDLAESWLLQPVGVKAGRPRVEPSRPRTTDIPAMSDDITADPAPAALEIELPEWLDEAPPVRLPGWLDEPSAESADTESADTETADTEALEPASLATDDQFAEDWTQDDPADDTETEDPSARDDEDDEATAPEPALATRPSVDPAAATPPDPAFDLLIEEAFEEGPPPAPAPTKRSAAKKGKSTGKAAGKAGGKKAGKKKAAAKTKTSSGGRKRS